MGSPHYATWIMLAAPLLLLLLIAALVLPISALALCFCAVAAAVVLLLPAARGCEFQLMRSGFAGGLQQHKRQGFKKGQVAAAALAAASNNSLIP